VKIIDIDLERRRISLSLKQANETDVATEADDFDPTLYGMASSYDEAGNYVYPDGFDPETGEWQEGFDEARERWEKQYAEAHERWEAHKKQVVEAEKAASEDSGEYSSGADESDEPTSSLASDEALQALREKLTGPDE
jgi:small subunit ribosomal protein S1